MHAEPLLLVLVRNPLDVVVRLNVAVRNDDIDVPRVAVGVSDLADLAGKSRLVLVEAVASCVVFATGDAHEHVLEHEPILVRGNAGDGRERELEAGRVVLLRIRRPQLHAASVRLADLKFGGGRRGGRRGREGVGVWFSLGTVVSLERCTLRAV